MAEVPPQEIQSLPRAVERKVSGVPQKEEPSGVIQRPGPPLKPIGTQHAVEPWPLPTVRADRHQDLLHAVPTRIRWIPPHPSLTQPRDPCSLLEFRQCNARFRGRSRRNSKALDGSREEK